MPNGFISKRYCTECGYDECVDGVFSGVIAVIVELCFVSMVFVDSQFCLCSVKLRLFVFMNLCKSLGNGFVDRSE